MLLPPVWILLPCSYPAPIYPSIHLTLSLAFHAVQSAKDLLVGAGFQEIKVL